jgi:hypothetical protein
MIGTFSLNKKVTRMPQTQKSSDSNGDEKRYLNYKELYNLSNDESSATTLLLYRWP